MKLLHIGDLHIGKNLNGYSLLEDQQHILEEISDIAEKEKPAAIILAGDIYDKAQPSAEAVSLFDRFLTGLSERCDSVFMISGNHDSPQRLSFGSALMKKGGVYAAPVYDGKIEPIVLFDEYGEVGFYCFPFVKPAHVRAVFPDERIDSYEDAFRVMLSKAAVPKTRRNVAVAHQFFVGAERGGSEETSVGGLDEISSSLLKDFDYAALGHIHRSQSVGRETVRYSGSILKYSFSEAEGNKSVTVVELKNKGEVICRTAELHPLRDMRVIRGSYAKLTFKKNYENTNVEDFIRVTLTDTDEIPDAIGKLRTIYPNIMELSYDNIHSRESRLNSIDAQAQLSPTELFSRFYAELNNAPMSDEQIKILEAAIEEIFSE